MSVPGPADDASDAPSAHLVLDEKELFGTRIARAVWESVPRVACGACDPEARKERASFDADGRELEATATSPKHERERVEGDWTRTFDAFRATEDARAGGRRSSDLTRETVVSQFDECNARLREDLDAIEGHGGGGEFGTPAVVDSSGGR